MQHFGQSPTLLLFNLRQLGGEHLQLFGPTVGSGGDDFQPSLALRELLRASLHSLFQCAMCVSQFVLTESKCRFGQLSF